MATEGNVKLTLAGKLSYAEEITIAQAVEILAFLHSGQEPSGFAGSGTASDTGVGGLGANRSGRGAGAMTPRQALDASGANSNSEKIVAFALQVSQQAGKETFTSEDIRPLFRQARESVPQNLSRDLATAIKNGWIAEAETNGEYYVTDKTLNVLKTGFDAVRSARGNGAKSRSGGGARKTRKASPMPEVFSDLDISPSVKGLINYHKVGTKREKYLWAVNAAKLLGINALATADIVWLTDHLGECIKTSDLTTYYRANLKAGYVNKNAEGKVRITPAGVDHVASLNTGQK